MRRPGYDRLGPSTLAGAERVGSMRVLGVEGAHLNGILSNSASSIHALRILRTHGLSQQQLREVARPTILASLLYAPLARCSFTTIRDRKRPYQSINQSINQSFNQYPLIVVLYSSLDIK